MQTGNCLDISTVILAAVCSCLILSYVWLPVNVWEITGMMAVTYVLYCGLSLLRIISLVKVGGHWLNFRDILQHLISFGGACAVGILTRTDLFCRYFYDMNQEKGRILGLLIQCLLLLGTVKLWRDVREQ